MQFRLLYSGRLLGASKTDTRASFKHQIRCDFSPQLKRLWETNNNLRRYAARQGTIWANRHPEDRDKLPEYQVSDDDLRSAYFVLGQQQMAEVGARGGQGFIPLITGVMGLRCKLDILFLRPEEPGFIVRGGDLDNRIKTLFDALRLPTVDEISGVQSRNEPIYCLMEDDRLISEVRVVADHLLLLPKESELNANDVFLVIDISLEAPPNSEYEWIFG